MNTLTVRIAIGAVAGALLAFYGVAVVCQTESPATFTPLLPAVSFGACVGSVIAVAAGGRAVSVFWVYLVVAFGGITILPWWYNGKTHTYLPLGTVYVNSLSREVVLTILLPHVLTSVTFAAVAVFVHRRLTRGSAGQVQVQAACSTQEAVEGTKGAAP